MKKRLRFTDKELELIHEMTGIADAAWPNEGDYQGWETDRKYETLYSIRKKILEKFTN